MKRFLAVGGAIAIALVGAGPSGAINDMLVPGDNCAPPNAEAVGHPALGSPPFPPPFSLMNPGRSTGAKGEAMAPGVGCPAPNK